MTDQTTKAIVLTKLKQGYTVLDFTKADGSTRTMTATLADSELPSPVTLDQAQNGDNVTVYEKNVGFRTFNWNRLNTVDGEALEGARD